MKYLIMLILVANFEEKHKFSILHFQVNSQLLCFIKKFFLSKLVMKMYRRRCYLLHFEAPDRDFQFILQITTTKSSENCFNLHGGV
jgi:hypothetical protein